MENIDGKLIQIRSDYFTNIFNQEFIIDSYHFLESISFFNKNEEDNKMSMFADVYKKYHTDIIFYQIKELYLNIANAAQPSEEINKANNSSNNANVKYSLYKLKGNYKEKMKEIINGINGVNVENENKKEEEEKVIKMSDNKYTEQIEKLMKKREEDERKENDFILKTETCFNHYEREEFVDFLRLINEDERLKNKIFTDKGENFKNNIVFEEKLLNYFLNEINTKEGYTKIKNNNFDMAFKQGKNDITIFFEKVLDISIVNLLSLIYEVEFYNKWFPFCKTSNCLIQPGKARKLVYLVNAIPIISDRDFLIYGFGVNRMQDNNTMLLLCKSIDAESGIFQEQFSKKKSKKFVRADINIFGFEMKILSKNKVHVKALLNADPKIGFIPQWIINTVSEKFASDLFTKLIEISKKYEGSEYQNKNPSKTDMTFYDFVEEEVEKLNLD